MGEGEGVTPWIFALEYTWNEIYEMKSIVNLIKIKKSPTI